MKKLNLIAALFILLAFMACKKETKTTTTDITKLPYTAKTPAQSKTDLENTGIDMVTQMKTLNKEVGMQATVNLMIVATNSSGSIISKSPGLGILKAAAAVNETKGVENVFASLRQTSDDISSYDSIAGTYTYNFKTGDFDKTTSSTLSFVFPASLADKNSGKNTGLLEIAKPTTQKGPYKIDDNTSITELPTYIQFDIKVNGTKTLNYEFTGAYNSDGMPTAISSTLTIGAFVFNTTWSYSTADVKLSNSFKNGKTTLVDIGGEITGQFDKASVIKLDTSNNPDPTLVLTNANAHFQLMNIKISGQVDFKGLYNGMNAIDKETKADTVKINEEIVLINKDATLVVVYADNNQMIAKAEPYKKTYQEQQFDFNSPNYVTVTKNELDVRVIFNDKSKGDLNTYFNDGFDNLINSFNSLIDDINATYGQTIGHVSKN